MEIFETIAGISNYVSLKKNEGKKVGFVPTMGALHEGHISLVEKSVEENDITVVSIFVNPIQFNNPQDLEKYPRDLDSDIKMLEAANVNAVFTPEVSEMYPEPVNKIYDLGFVTSVMEGEFRPGHFNGVAIVVNKLFDIVKPDSSYFGEKDFQQLMVIRELVKKENIPVKIVGCPISREEDGLARSSRNMRLTPEMRKAAPFIYRQLLSAREMAKNMTASELQSYIVSKFQEHPLLKIEYFTIADGDTLRRVEGAIEKGAYGFIAVYAGDIRLIDNIRLI